MNMCQYTLLDVGGVKIDSIQKDESNVKGVKDILQISMH